MTKQKVDIIVDIIELIVFVIMNILAIAATIFGVVALMEYLK